MPDKICSSLTLSLVTTCCWVNADMKIEPEVFLALKFTVLSFECIAVAAIMAAVSAELWRIFVRNRF